MANQMSGLLVCKEFYVFNSKFSSSETDEIKKVLYYYPHETNIDTQLKRVGLCEAIIQFSGSFSDSVCDSLNTQLARYVFCEVETGYWFVMVILIPQVTKTSVPEGINCIDFQYDQVQDTIFKEVLKWTYQKFILLNDTFETILKTQGINTLKFKLRKFIDLTLKKIELNKCGISETFKGLQFLPLNRQLFLKIQCFINLFMLTWQKYNVDYLILLQSDKLIWSGISQNDIRIFYEYLIKDRLSQYILPNDGSIIPQFGIIFKKESHITLSTDLTFKKESELDNKSVNSKTSSETERTRFHVLIFKAESSYLILLLNDKEPLENDLIENLESFLSLNFIAIAKELAGGQTNGYSSNCANNLMSQGGLNNNQTNNLIMGTGPENLPPPHINFIYFNKLNLAEKKTPGSNCHTDIDAYRILSDLKNDLDVLGKENGEVIVKMMSDYWISAKMSNKREFYTLINQKGLNLLNVEEETQKLTEAHLANIFF